MTLTQEQFFGAIADNLKNLAQNHPSAVPYSRLNGGWKFVAKIPALSRFVRLSKFKIITNQDVYAPENLQAYDLMTPSVFGCQVRFRVAAYFIEGEPTAETYERAKAKVLTWHNRRTDNGNAPGERFAVGALVIGTGKPWGNTVRINGNKVPAEIDFQLLAAPSAGDTDKGPDVSRRLGDMTEGREFFRAFEPEPFNARKERVWETTRKMLSSGVGGNVYAADVAKRSGVLAEDVIHIFNELEGEGRLCVKKNSKRKGDLAERVFVEEGDPSWFRQRQARLRGPWYGQKSPYAKISLGFGLTGLCYILKMCGEKILPEHLTDLRWWLTLGGIALWGFFIFGIWALIRHK